MCDILFPSALTKGRFIVTAGLPAVIPAMRAYLLPIWKFFYFLFGNIVKAPASRPLLPDGKSSLLGYIDDLVFVICFQY